MDFVSFSGPNGKKVIHLTIITLAAFVPDFDSAIG
jgi:hypothetical protein